MNATTLEENDLNGDPSAGERPIYVVLSVATHPLAHTAFGYPDMAYPIWTYAETRPSNPQSH